MLFSKTRFQNLSDYFGQMASMTQAGLSVLTSLENLEKSPPSSSLRKATQTILHELKEGNTLHRSMESTGKFFSYFDLALIEAGEKSGRIDDVFRLLSSFYEQEAQRSRRIKSAFVYPAILVFMAGMIFPVSGLTGLLLEGKVTEFFVQKGMLFGPIIAIAFLLKWAFQSKSSVTWQRLVQGIPIPYLKSAQKNLALARFTAALEALYHAGISILEAWQMAGTASGSHDLNAASQRIVHGIDLGYSPSDLLHKETVFPTLFRQLYSSAEMSGKLDESLHRLRIHFEMEADEKFDAFAFWLPKAAYFGVVFIVAWQIIQFYTNYFSMIGELTK